MSGWLLAWSTLWGSALALLSVTGGNGAAATNAAPGAASARVHAEAKFVFHARAPLEEVAPLMGADKERCWAPGWIPQFIYPQAAADVQGMVFTTIHDGRQATWVNTDFDLKNGRVQYVYVVPARMVTVITLNLVPEGNQTRVEVQYDRTSLTPEADVSVQHLAEDDRRAGSGWEEQVNAYLEKAKLF